MNRYLALGCLGLGLMVSPLLGALRGAQSAVPSNPKIGVIDMENTVSTTPAGKRAHEAFEKTRKAKQADIDKREGELKKAAMDLEKQRPVLKEDAYKQKVQELQKKGYELSQVALKLERELAAAEAKLINDLLAQAKPHIEKIAKAEGISVILERRAVLWIEPTVDLTAKLNAEMK